MAKNAKDNGPDKNEARKKLQNILLEPLTQQRLFLAAKLNAARNPMQPQPFTSEEFEKFIRSIPDTHNMMVKEVDKVLSVVKSGTTLETPDLRTPSSQLLWGATLAWLSVNPDAIRAWDGAPADPTAKPKPVNVTKTALWNLLKENRVSADEMARHASQIRETLRSKVTKYGWSAPGTGTRYDRQKDFVHFDLTQNLISGFEHSRADIHRQIGFALNVQTYPVRMSEVAKEMQPLMIKAQKASAKKGPQLKQDEYKKLQLLSAEWQLRHMLFMAAEEGNMANRYATDLSKKFLQDIGVSVNNSAVTTRGIGLVSPLSGGQEMSEEHKRYINLCHAIEMSFFQNNKLFDDTNEAWRQAGVMPELVRTLDTLKKTPKDQRGIEHPDFKYLRELCGGKDGLEYQQVGQVERMFGNFLGRIGARDAKRKEIIEEIEQKYTEHLLQKILEQVNDQVQQDLDQAQQNQQDGPPQEGEGQEGEEGQANEGQGQGQGKGKPQKGKPQKGSGGGGGEPGDEQGEGSEGQEKGQKGQKGKPQKGGGKGDEQGEDGEGSESGDGGKGEKKEKKEGKDQEKGGGAEGDIGKDENKSVPVEGAGDMPGVKDAAQTPEDEAKQGQDNDKDAKDGQDGQDGDSDDADGQDADGDEGKTLEQMLKEKAEQEAQDAQDADGEGAEGQAQDGQEGKGGKPKQSGGKQAGHGGGKSLGDLAKEDWTKYEDRVNELRGPISRARKLFKQVQERQLQPKKTLSKQLEMLPENGEVMERFNLEAHRNMTIKKATRDIEEQDLKRFQTDERRMVPTEIDVVILIDGSGSMVPHPLDSALQAGAILFEAANGKDMKMNVYVGLWGNEDPPILIRPGDTPTKIGQAMQTYRRGLNSGTDLAPAIRNTAKVIGEQRGRAGTLSGFTHILVISDGDIGDADAAHKAIETLFTFSDKTTIDTAVINSGRQTQMEMMAKDVSKRTAKKDYHTVGVSHEVNADQVPDAILGLLLDKIRKCGSFKAVPNTEKRRAMKKAHDKMEGKNRP